MKSHLAVPLLLIWIVIGCNSSKNGSDPSSGTFMQGMWSISATATSAGTLGQCPQDCGPGTYQVSFVSSPCTVTTPVGMFSVQGPVCFIANNNSGQGSISGTGLSTDTTKNTQQGILIGVASNPAATGATFNAIFVAGDKNGNFVEGTASGTVGNGSMKGTGSCSSNTPICQGVSGTFSANHQ
jgi:hypothetical protein